MKTTYQPIYDIERSYQDNFDKGPFFMGSMPERIFKPQNEWIDFLGHRIASRLGVPAGPLLNANWVAFAAKMGFDVLTYKTIRSSFHPAHPLPNMVYLKTDGQLKKEEPGEVVVQSDLPSSDISSLSATNSFGMPSFDPDFVIADIAKANAQLQPGQVMIVSCVGTPKEKTDFVQDFVRAALIAKEGGAKIIEANFSCPNVLSKEGSIYQNPEAVFEIAQAIVQAIAPIPLIIKVGTFFDKELLTALMLAAARAGVSAICGINTASRKVVTEDGVAALGKGRERAGVCGGPIREAALTFLRLAHTINQEEKLNLTLLGTGGATLPEHFDAFCAAGAKVAMSAVGMMWDPYLAYKYHKEKAHAQATCT